ncbi:hypothetical protein DIPPA_14066 [Diplonema papillatum]|nr:hypothetical protein DIPPA_14066 [Diplonema papillatum]
MAVPRGAGLDATAAELEESKRVMCEKLKGAMGDYVALVKAGTEAVDRRQLQAECQKSVAAIEAALKEVSWRAADFRRRQTAKNILLALEQQTNAAREGVAEIEAACSKIKASEAPTADEDAAAAKRRRVA